MDDEISRMGIKEELTTRDEYLENRFQGLSSSGHDITRMTGEDKIKWAAKYACIDLPWLDQEKGASVFLGSGQRGLYIAAIGGLPVFASGTRLDHISGPNCIAFSEPCDPDHIFVEVVNDPATGFKIPTVYCVRSAGKLGTIVSEVDMPDYYAIDPSALHFLPLNTKWPVESQPENFWGTEGQYRGWNENELSTRPLSY